MINRYILNPFFLDEPMSGLEELAKPGWHINRAELPESTMQTRMSAIHQPLASRVAETLRQGERPITVAGDCCAALPVAAGLEHAGINPILIWLDAHGDFNTWDTTPSGFIGGMPLAMLVGYGDGTLMDALNQRSLPADRVILTDARDLDPAEQTLLAQTAVRHLSDPRVLLSATLPQGPTWVHFDVDIIDPRDAPSVLYPAPGGLSAARLAKIFRSLVQQREIVAVSMSTWAPEQDTDGHTRDVCLRLLSALTGSP